jgi:hypothetical protein
MKKGIRIFALSMLALSVFAAPSPFIGTRTMHFSDVNNMDAVTTLTITADTSAPGRLDGALVTAKPDKSGPSLGWMHGTQTGHTWQGVWWNAEDPKDEHGEFTLTLSGGRLSGTYSEAGKKGTKKWGERN